MTAIKIGAIREGGIGLNRAHARGDESSLLEVIQALRQELDALYEKLDLDIGVADVDYYETLPRFTE